MRTPWCAQLHVYFFLIMSNPAWAVCTALMSSRRSTSWPLSSSWLTLQPEAFLQGEERRKKPHVGLRGLSRQPILLRQRKTCLWTSAATAVLRSTGWTDLRIIRIEWTQLKKPALHSALKEEKKISRVPRGVSQTAPFKPASLTL